MTDEIDLIPNDYRIWRGQRSELRRYSLLFVLVNAAVLATSLLLGHTASLSRTEAAHLKSKNAATQQQQVQLQQLTDQQTEYERQWALLRSLRAGAALDDIFVLIDRSLVAGDLWFLDWSFRRAGVVVTGQQRGTETGYFIIVSNESTDLTDLDLKVETHMSIHGQAQDHQALSTFLRALFEQPDIKDVNVQKTSQSVYANGYAIDFDVTVVLSSAFKDT